MRHCWGAFALAVVACAACSVGVAPPGSAVITCRVQTDCPSSLVCVLDVGRCVQPGTDCVVQRPEGFFSAPDGNTCTLDGNPEAVCKSGVCSLCGNGKVESGEGCDDGANADERDGCTSLCEVPVCGDRIVTARAETCDDGNDNNNDACADCQSVQWAADIAFGLGPRRDGLSTTTLPGMTSMTVSRYGAIYVGVAQDGRTEADASGLPGAANIAGVIWQLSETADALIRVAGSGAANTEPHGEGLVGRFANLSAIGGVVTDGRGTLYFTENGTHKYVMRLDAQGMLHIVAGTGENCESAPTGCGNSSAGTMRLARNAQLIAPGALAFDQSGNLYFADGSTIRRISPDGFISLFAGANTTCAGADADCENLPGRGAVGTKLGEIDGLAIDSQNAVYVAETYRYAGNQRNARGVVRVISTSNTISVVAGTEGAPVTALTSTGGAAIAFSSTNAVYPFDGSAVGKAIVTGRSIRALATDPEGRLLVLDSGSGSPTITRTGDSTPLFGTPRATELPSGVRGTGVDSQTRAVAVRPNGDLVFSTGRQIMSWSAATGLVEFVAGIACEDCGVEGPVNEVRFDNVVDIALVDDAIYVLDVDRRLGVIASMGEALEPRNQLRRIRDGRVTTVAGRGGFCSSQSAICDLDVASGNALAVTFDRLLGMDVAGGIAYLTTVNRLWRVDLASGNAIAVTGSLSCPYDVAISGSDAYIADSVNCRIARWNGSALTPVVSTSANCAAGTSLPSCDLDATADARYPVRLDVLNDEITYAVSLQSELWTVKTDGTNRTRIADGEGSNSVEEDKRLEDTKLGETLFARGDDGSLFVYERLGAIRRTTGSERITRTIIGPVDIGYTGAYAKTELGVLVQAAPFVAGNAMLMDAGQGTARRVEFASASVFPVMGYAQPAGVLLSSDTPRATRYVRRFTNRNNRGGGVAFDAARSILYTTSNEGIVITQVAGNDSAAWTSLLLDPAMVMGPGDTSVKPSQLVFNELALSPDGTRLYATDMVRNVIYALPVGGGRDNGYFETIAGRGEFIGDRDAETGTDALFNTPRGIAVSAHGAIYVADQLNNRVRRIEAGGKHAVTTVLGTGVPSSVGDGTPASAMPVDAPVGVTFDAFNNLIVVGRETVRVVLARGTTEADEPNAGSTTATIYDATNPDGSDFAKADLTPCLKAPFRGATDDELYIGDGCTGAVLRLRRQ